MFQKTNISWCTLKRTLLKSNIPALSTYNVSFIADYFCYLCSKAFSLDPINWLYKTSLSGLLFLRRKHVFYL